MGCFRIIEGESVERALEDAVLRNLSLSVTVRHQNRWMTLRSWLIAEFGGFVWLDYPMGEDESATHEFQPGDKVSITFRVAHRRYVFSVRVVGTEPYELDDQTESMALKVAAPEKMQLVERRTESRVHLPSRLNGRVMFWLGGHDSQPSEGSVDRPMWAGKIINLSSGGAYIRSNKEAANYVEVGDVVGLKLNFGEEVGEVVVDAQFRHAEPDGEMALLGFQFVDDDSAPEEARVGLETVRELVRGFGGGEDEGQFAVRQRAGAGA